MPNGGDLDILFMGICVVLGWLGGWLEVTFITKGIFSFLVGAIDHLFVQMWVVFY
jgi:hypothetical protein